MDVNDFFSAFYIPILYAVVAGFLTALVLYILSLKKAKYSTSNYYAARLAFFVTFIPLIFLSIYFQIAEHKKLHDLNDGWMNVALLSVILISVVLSSWIGWKGGKID